jgi:uncharacterized protein YndB with AHSA1/START domain
MTGVLRADGERRSVRFERRYGATQAELWSALTEPEQLRGWLAEATFEPREGGSVEVRFGARDAETVRGRVLKFDPPRLLEYEWHWPGEDESVVRFELVPESDGTLLVLDHRRLPVEAAAGYSAGWHAHLDKLESLFGGVQTSWDERFAQLLPTYRQRAAAS